MAWTTPTLVEICIGLEINGYLPADSDPDFRIHRRKGSSASAPGFLLFARDRLPRTTAVVPTKLSPVTSAGASSKRSIR